MSKFVKKLIPFESSDIPAIQSWLEDMAEQGLFYVDCGFFCARFERGEPKKLRYRLDFCNVSLGKIPEDKAELYERSSWRVVGELKNDLVVLTTDDPDAPEIFSEPEHLIAPLKRLAKKHTAYWILFLIMFLLSRVCSPFVYSMTGMDTFVGAVLDIGTAYYILLLLMAVVLLLEFIVHLRRCRHLKKLIKQIEQGGELPTGESYKAKSKIGAVLIPLTIPVIVLWFVHLAIPMGETYGYPTNDLSGLPFPTIQEISTDEYNYYLDGLKNLDGDALANISERHDLLAPTIIEFSQDCLSFEHLTDKGDNSFDYFVRYYEMRFEKDAKEAVDLLIYDYEHFDAEDYHRRASALAKSISENFEEHEINYDGYTPTYDIKDLSRDGVEIKLVNEKYGYGEDDTQQHLIMRYKSKYIKVSYTGSSDLGEYTDLYIAKLKA